ncbi:COG4223 family protein [Jannaschia seosinensis]|nr:hypothetical protein [Jannaschia seosinensis]
MTETDAVTDDSSQVGNNVPDEKDATDDGGVKEEAQETESAPVEDATVVSEEPGRTDEETAAASDADADAAVRREADAADEIYVNPEGEAVAGSEVGPDPRPESDREASDESDATGHPLVTQPSPKSSPAAGERRRSGGFVPLVLGGLMAGGIGYVIALFTAGVPAPGVDPARIAALEEEVATFEPAEVAAPVDLSEIEATQDAFASDLAALAMRVAALESAPAAEPSERGSPAAGASTAVPSDAAPGAQPLAEDLRGEIADLTEAVDEIRSRLSTISDDVDMVSGDVAAISEDVAANESDIAALRDDLAARIEATEAALAEASARAESVETEAVSRAREAARNQVAQALESGATYVEPLAVLGDPPAALERFAETGVPTLNDLADDFPALARTALREARAEAAGSEGVASLFRNALNPRSLEPRAGSDPDAVLSRAEAAIRTGDLEEALAEIETLPEAAAEVLEAWQARAEARAAAVSAADTYLQDE